MFILQFIKFYQADGKYQLKAITEHALCIIPEVESLTTGLQKRYLARNIFDPQQLVQPVGFPPFQCRRAGGNGN